MAVQDGFSDPGITNNSKIRFFFSKKRYFPGNFIFHPVLYRIFHYQTSGIPVTSRMPVEYH